MKKRSLASIRFFQEYARGHTTTTAESASRRRGLGCSAPIDRFAEKEDKKDKQRR